MAPTTAEDPITPAMKAHDGSGVPRTRLSTPESRRMVSETLMFVKVAPMTPKPISAGT